MSEVLRQGFVFFFFWLFHFKCCLSSRLAALFLSDTVFTSWENKAFALLHGRRVLGPPGLIVSVRFNL